MKSKLIRALCVILAVVVSFTAIVQPPAKAIAIADDILLLGVLLVALGFTFANVGDFQTAVKELAYSFGDDLEPMLANCVIETTKLEVVAGSVGVLSLLANKIVAMVKDGTLSIPDYKTVVYVDGNGKELKFWDPGSVSSVSTSQLNTAAKTIKVYELAPDKVLEIPAGNYLYSFYRDFSSSNHFSVVTNLLTGKELKYSGLITAADADKAFGRLFLRVNRQDGPCLHPVNFYFSAGSWTTSLSFYTIDSTNIKNAYDIPLADLGTKPGVISIPIDDTGEYDRDAVIGAIGGGATLDIPDVLTDLTAVDPALPMTSTQAGTLADTLTPDISIPADPAIPIDGMGDVDGMKIPQVYNKFPFSVPFALISLVEKLNATGEAPRWVIPFKIAGVVNYSFVIDMSQFESVAAVMRTLMTILFIAALILITRNIIKG